MSRRDCKELHKTSPLFFHSFAERQKNRLRQLAHKFESKLRQDGHESTCNGSQPNALGGASGTQLRVEECVKV